MENKINQVKIPNTTPIRTNNAPSGSFVANQNLADKKEVKTQEKPEAIQKNNQTNTDESKKKSVKLSFLGKLKQKWKNHVAKNKAKSEAKKNKTNPLEKSKNLNDENKNKAVNDPNHLVKNSKENQNKAENLNPIVQKNLITHSETQGKKNPSITAISGIELDEFIENFNPKKDKSKLTKEMRLKIMESEKFYQQGMITIKDLIAPSSMEISSRGMRLNHQFIRSYYVYNYPRFLEMGWMNQIINFDATIDLSLFIYPTSSGQMIKILRKKITEMMSTKRLKQKSGRLNDVSLDTALDDAQQLRVDLQRGTERFFQVGVYLTVYGDSEEKLNIICKQVETILGGQLVMVRPADFQTERGFNSTLPQGLDEFDQLRNMNTGPLSTTFPFISSSLTSNEGILYGINRHNNSLIIFDRFNLENANSVIFAKSGAGKSYTVKLEILRSLMLGTDVIILDPEKEYKNITTALGGAYMDISLNSKTRINPFDILQPLNEETNTRDLLRENVITLMGLMNVMLGKLSPEEESVMEKALFQTYEIKGITEKTKNPQHYEMPTMQDLHRVLMALENAQKLALRLEKYSHGIFSGLFSSQSNIDLESGLICFCLRDLEDRLRPIMMHILLNFIWNRVRSELKRRMLVIDEAWNIVQHEDSGRFLHNLCKRARKYYLGITTITQDVEDFLDSPWGKPIITNSSMQLLLRQSPTAIERLKKVFNLTEQEKNLLISSGVGQGLFFAGNQHVAIEIIASYSEDKIVTTNPKQILEQQP